MPRMYLNPVYRHSCPDPFVLKHCGEYWCYFTGKEYDGRAFGILHSTDLVHWEYISGALIPLPGDLSSYWAPEVTYQDGIFYLYYAVGDGEQMQIRVGTSDRPEGPFTDSGKRLSAEPFAIDPHVFIDDDGTWYLFYATDFLDVERVGTGTVVDRMLDPFTLAGKPRPVTRAQFDWQIFDPQRSEKGGVRWHTVEGPFVLNHNGWYYQMFSGGNWKNASYGVAYGLSDRLDSSVEWSQPCDAGKHEPVLYSDAERGVIGPGHNSVVRAPDNRQLVCVYHRWQPETEERVLAIDPLAWEGERLVVYGPSTSPQPAPKLPDLSGFDQFRAQSGVWKQYERQWRLGSADGRAEVVLEGLPPSFLLELSLRFVQPSSGEIGVALKYNQREVVELALSAAENQSRLVAGKVRHSGLLAGFNPYVFHLLRLEVGGSSARLSVDGPLLTWDLSSLEIANELHLFSLGAMAAFAGFALSW